MDAYTVPCILWIEYKKEMRPRTKWRLESAHFFFIFYPCYQHARLIWTSQPAHARAQTRTVYCYCLMLTSEIKNKGTAKGYRVDLWSIVPCLKLIWMSQPAHARALPCPALPSAARSARQSITCEVRGLPPMSLKSQIGMCPSGSVLKKNCCAGVAVGSDPVMVAGFASSANRRSGGTSTVPWKPNHT